MKDVRSYAFSLQNLFRSTKENSEVNLLRIELNNMYEKIDELTEEKNKNQEALKEKSKEISSQRDEINALYQETIAMNEELYNLLDEVKDNYLSTVRALAKAIEAKDKYTKGHCDRVTKYSLAIAKQMNLSNSHMEKLEFASVLHDIGKIGIPSTIINKNGKLTDDEYSFIKRHPEIGYDILKDIRFLGDSIKVMLQHHERIDGKGYPYGITGKEMGKLSKILSVADSYDAMTSSRPYRLEPLSEKEAIEQLEKNKGTQFDEETVEILVKLIKTGYFKED